MKIARVESWREEVELSRPYTITRGTIDAVELFFVRLVPDRGAPGLGSASPAPGVTGETPTACAEALDPERLEWLVGREPRRLGELLRSVRDRLRATPAARAAVDVALHDLLARHLETPLVELLGRRRREPLPTSVTLGIGPVEETLAQAEEWVGRGFHCLKVKVGRDFDADVARLRRLRERFGGGVAIRVDANQGYDDGETRRLGPAMEELGLELLEQPSPRGTEASMRNLPEPLRRRIAADESVHHAADAFALLREPRACGIFNVKLMKCGGVAPALEIATVAEAAGVELMWGCMDESAVSIAAALHAAYASPSTRYLDLDGSFDLARDPAVGGFEVADGRLRLLDRPGLGVELREER